MNKVYQVLASRVDAWARCVKENNSLWEEKHMAVIQGIMRDIMPGGSGWDCGTKMDEDKSTGEKLVLYGSFHHMDEGGGYDGWTEHTIIVRPSLILGFILTISGRNRNDIKEYLYEMFGQVLNEEVKDADVIRWTEEV